MKKKVAVLLGGFSVEREVSLSSGQGVVKALQELGHEAIPIDVTRDMREFVQNLEIHKPDVVLNILHGRWGEDGCVQGLLEMMNIPYSHSGVLGSALSMNKVISRKICQSEGIRIPEGQVAKLADICAGRVMKPPYVIKPIGEGSSLGVYVILDETSPLPNLQDWPFEDEVLVERYIPGRELHVTVVGEKAIGAIETRTPNSFLDFEAKYTEGKAEHLMPAPVHKDVYAEALSWGEKAHKVLGCRGVSRSDFRYDDTQGEPGLLYYLETNPQPGFTPMSLVPETAAHEGISYAQLVQWMVEDASCRR
ncbi:MAG: D-alanine--D-alanine ligase [Proteobacteria bacterium]|nr:D-alanine--D-alanine ligase [Pseudomonadota bacterium]